MPLLKTTTKCLKYVFSERELTEISSDLAKTIREKSQLEDEKKSVTSQYAAKINEKNASANSAASKITNGYEFRDVECWIDYDLRTRMKTIARKDSGEIIEEVPMTAQELQMEIPGMLPPEQAPEPDPDEESNDDISNEEQENNPEIEETPGF